MPNVLPPDHALEEKSFEGMDLGAFPNPEEALLEIDALNQAARVADLQGDPMEATNLVRKAKLRRAPSNRPEDRLIQCAMNRIVGDPLSEEDRSFVSGLTWEDSVTEGLIGSWICWALGERREALEGIRGIRNRQQNEEHVGGGAVNLLSLYFWAGAIEALAQENVSLSKKLWKRAIEVASSFGTESSLLIQWAYAGSFFRSN